MTVLLCGHSEGVYQGRPKLSQVLVVCPAVNLVSLLQVEMYTTRECLQKLHCFFAIKGEIVEAYNIYAFSLKKQNPTELTAGLTK